jgi:hypothetical protein
MKMETMIKSASVKIMLSYDYSHFETCMSLENEEGVTNEDIDNARKDCQRLCDKAISQYKIARSIAEKRTDSKFRIHNFEQECQRIEHKAECDRTIKEIGILKQYQEENWKSQFDFGYDYEDDYEDIDR